MDERLHVAMQQLLRYGAFAQLLTSLQSLSTVDAAAGALARQWKFCANVSDWRFIATVDREAMRIDAAKGVATVNRMPVAELLPWERHYAVAASLHSSPADTQVQDPEHGFPEALQQGLFLERMIVPVSVGDRPLGAFFIGTDTAAFDALDRKFIELVASLFAGRVADLVNHEAETALLRRQATIDALTLIANRRQFDTRFELEWLHAARVAQPLALILVDIDFFKQYNDLYGHQQGDVCLREVAQALQTAVRPTDLVARIGGEEFGILLPNIGTTGAALVAQRVRCAVAQASIPHGNSAVAGQVTVSLGVASAMPGAKVLAPSLYADADQGLYAAKRGGRNRVHVHSGPNSGGQVRGA